MWEMNRKQLTTWNITRDDFQIDNRQERNQGRDDEKVDLRRRRRQSAHVVPVGHCCALVTPVVSDERRVGRTIGRQDEHGHGQEGLDDPQRKHQINRHFCSRRFNCVLVLSYRKAIATFPNFSPANSTGKLTFGE